MYAIIWSRIFFPPIILWKTSFLSAWGSGMARIISVPWLVRCLPIILIGRIGSTPGSWRWLTSGVPIVIANMATRWHLFSSPSRVTTRALSADPWFRRSCSGGIMITLYCQKNGRCFRQCARHCSSTWMSSIRYLLRCSRDF